jgi:hypothetical protein
MARAMHEEALNQPETTTTKAHDEKRLSDESFIRCCLDVSNETHSCHFSIFQGLYLRHRCHFSM